MSDESIAELRKVKFSKKKNIVIVASTYNKKYTDALVNGAESELKRIVKTKLNINTIRVPGAFEIPLTVAKILNKNAKKASKFNKISAIIALGVIIEGETAHADLVARSVTDALQNLALQNLTPIIHEVLLLKNKSQAEQRCIKKQKNRGIESAQTCVQFLKTLEKL